MPDFEIKLAYKEYLAEEIPVDISPYKWARKNTYPFSVPGNIALSDIAFTAGYHACLRKIELEAKSPTAP